MLLKSLSLGSNSPEGNPVYFNSTRHTRVQGGQEFPQSVCGRQVKIEKNISGKRGYSVTIFNTDGAHPLWGNNVQMSTKPMEVIAVGNECVELRGYGYDENALAMGVPPEMASFSSYGLRVYISQSGEIFRCILLLLDRGVSIDYR